MESREVPAALTDNGIAIPYYDGVNDSTVQFVSAPTTAPLLPIFTPFPGYKGPLAVAAGDVTGGRGG